jgi:glycosyltransferase involved in cell wall biosynthesis
VASVLMIAYNVENFIAAALDSVLEQDVDFDYEIVVGEDCSTDTTRTIVEEYASRFPQVVRPVLRPHNLGMNANFFATLQECRGRYVALLDADDYWCHPHKLRKQVEFLEAHPEFSTCFHNAEVVYDDGTQPAHPFHMADPQFHLSAPIPKETSTLEDIIAGNFLQTGSVVFRNGLVGPIPAWFFEMPTFDWPLHVANAVHGRIRYMDEVWSAYRVHETGMWSMNMSYFRSIRDVEHMLRAYRLLDEHFDRRFHDRIRRHSRWLHLERMHLSYREGRIRQGNRDAANYFSGLTAREVLREWPVLRSVMRANLRFGGWRAA